MRYIIGFAVAVLLAISAWVWFAHSGGGSYGDSPDGKYLIRTSNLDGETLTQGHIEYIKIEIVENSTDKIIWSLTRNVINDEKVTNFRANDHTKWATDSKSVSVTISNSEIVVIPLP